jgi:hypothetical protein
MKIFYYVVHPQLEEVDDFKETNGWKDITVYHVLNNKLKITGSFEILMEENSQDEVLDFLHQDIDEDEIIKLVQL